MRYNNEKAGPGTRRPKFKLLLYHIAHWIPMVQSPSFVIACLTGLLREMKWKRWRRTQPLDKNVFHFTSTIYVLLSFKAIHLGINNLEKNTRNNAWQTSKRETDIRASQVNSQVQPLLRRGEKRKSCPLLNFCPYKKSSTGCCETSP